MFDPPLGQHELQDRLGRGGRAAVLRALQPSLAQLPDPMLSERFRREAADGRETARSGHRWLLIGAEIVLS